MKHLLVRAPSHLGDGVMALPALAALRERGNTTVLAPPWGETLYGHLDVQLAGLRDDVRADVGLTFAPSWSSAWALRRCGSRYGVPGERGRRVLLTTVAPAGTHRRDTYGNVAALAGARVSSDPVLPIPDLAPAPDLPSGHVALFPATATGATVQWTGFRTLADRLDQAGLRPIFYAGPGEGARVASVAGRHRVVQPTSLRVLMRSLADARAVVANDSGASHLARALGRPTVVVFGSTDPAVTGAAGCVPVVGPRLPCAPCYGKQCAAELGCLRVPVAQVERALETAWAA